MQWLHRRACAMTEHTYVNKSISKRVYDSNRVRYSKASIRKFTTDERGRGGQPGKQPGKASRAPAAWPMSRTMWASNAPEELAHSAAGGPTPKSTLGILEDSVHIYIYTYITTGAFGPDPKGPREAHKRPAPCKKLQSLTTARPVEG